MQIKINKDQLIKQRFWVLLGVSLPLVLVALFILITSVSADIETERKKVKDMTTKIAKPGSAVGPQMIDKFSKVEEERKAKETDVHRDAFAAQETIATFPVEFEKKFDFQKGWFATDVKLLPTPTGDEKDWPADGDDLIHGVVKFANEVAAVVVGRDKKEFTIRRTAKDVLKVTRQEKKDGEKDLGWKDIGPGAFVAVTYYKSKYFYDPFTADEQFEFAREYKTQVHPILTIVDPVDTRGQGVVQLGTWLYGSTPMPPPKSKFFTFVSEEWVTDAPIFEEAWLAQEDLWIQRELYRIIREANDSVSKCKVGDDPQTNQPIYVNPTAEDRARPAVFYNPYYELKFEWVGDSKLMVTVRNMLNRRQKVDVAFRVKLSKTDNQQLASQVIKIDDEPLNPRGHEKDSCKKEIAVIKGGLPRTGVYEVEQILNWETAAVKRIDQVAIGQASGDVAHSHRTFPEGSKPYRAEEKKDEKKEDNGGKIGGAPGVPGGGQIGMKGFGGFGGNNQENAAASFTVNGILKDRYLEVSDQSRRLPVALALIVDQDHINRVLTAFNNSKLRFLTNQVLLNRYAGSVRPAIVAGGPVGGGGQGPAVGGGQPPQPGPMGAKPSSPGGSSLGPTPGGGSSLGPKGGSSLGPTPGGGSSLGPTPGGGSSLGPSGGIGIPGGGLGGQPNFPGGAVNPGATASSAGTEELENNVELVLYGVVTLYERYPKRKTVADNK